ncbi:MAG: type I secretion system permease/ATPase [Sphingomonadaceae bacterium]|nr:type I secretion system permease/ATPase [Sphingomonadaceae bacterium]
MADGPDHEARHADPLIACLDRLADRFGVGFAPTLFSSLVRGGDGQLPRHQVEPAAEILGLNCDARKLPKLPRQVEHYPAIVSLEGGALAVIEDYREGDMLVWRPASDEARWEPAGEVQAEYTGWMATVFGDATAIRSEGQPWQENARTHWFWSEVYKLRHDFRPVLVASMLINVLALALPLFTMNVYDRVIPNRAQATLWVLASGVLIAFILDYSLRRARTKVLDGLGRDLDLKLSQKIYSKVLSAPLAARKGYTGNMVARVSEFAIVRDFFASTTIVLIVDLFFMVFFIALIAYIAGWLALVPIVIAAAMLVMGLRLQRKVSEAAIEAQADRGLQQTLLVESISGIETLKSVAGEGTMLGRWRRLAELGAQSERRLRDISSTAIGLAATCQQLTSISLVVGGYYLFAAGKITMGAIIAIVMLASRSLAPAGQFAFLLTRGKQALHALESIQTLWGESDERRMGSASVAPQVRSAHLKLERLSFSYPDASGPSLSELNLEINPGERIAVIGRVASGKSTLGRILCGLYQPSEGALLVDGIDSQQYRPQDLRMAMRFVGQDANLFSGTIKDNLSLGSDRPSDEELIEALRRIGADEFLSRDAGGFDRAVGESGIRLSGGQRAFLTLSRAFVSPSRLLFLDEPTGAMDSQTEKLFVDRLSQSLTPDQTLIISTHRPALFSVCDRLIVLDKGRIVADGPRDEVIASASAGQKV